MTATDDDLDLQPAVAAGFEALADVLSRAPDSQWDSPSLCQGWRVREVVAHMTMPARYSEDEFVEELRNRDFDFTRLSNEIAASDGGIPKVDLLTDLRSEVLHRWTPRQGGIRGALNHVVIHSLDITVPLRLERLAPDEMMRVVLDDLTIGGVHTYFGVDLEGRHLEATDLDWSYGSGRRVSGPAELVALAICGRTVPDGRLLGDRLGER